MEIISLKLLNFRNFDELKLEFSNNKNIIIGDNGVGKTNIVESIFVLAFTKSFRTNDDEYLLKKEQIFYKIEGEIKSSLIKKYKIIYQDGIKSVKIDNKKIIRYGDYISNINVILFSINDLKFIKDIPTIRRKLINLEMSQLDNSYVKYLNCYNKILKQRNIYLKKVYKKEVNYNYLSVLDKQLINYGLKISDMRNTFISNINLYINIIFNNFGGIGNLNIKYKSDYHNLSLENIHTIYEKNYEKDINFGSTQYGIHKDDFLFCVDDCEIKYIASEGQQKMAILAFKYAEVELFNKIRGEYPILILDDLFSELDLKKITNILNYINENMQVIITTTDLKKIKKKYLKSSKIFEINKNEIKESLYE